MIHGNINPENILINKNGDWKLAGFNFATYDNYQTSTQVIYFKQVQWTPLYIIDISIIADTCTSKKPNLTYPSVHVHVVKNDLISGIPIGR